MHREDGFTINPPTLQDTGFEKQLNMPSRPEEPAAQPYCRPKAPPHLAIVATQVAHILAGVRVVYGNGCAIDCCKVLATLAEAALPAALKKEGTGPQATE